MRSLKKGGIFEHFLLESLVFFLVISVSRSTVHFACFLTLGTFAPLSLP